MTFTFSKWTNVRYFLNNKLNTLAYVMSHLIAPGDGHVVEYPVVLVVHQHPLLQQGQPLHTLTIPHTVALLAQHLVAKKLDLLLNMKKKIPNGILLLQGFAKVQMFLIIWKIIV
jgi:hypothetical protein